jgi:MFS family permease
VATAMQAGDPPSRAGFATAAASLRLVSVNPDLVRLAASLGAWVAGDWAFLVGLSVLAYAAGGIQAVGIVGAIRVLPAAAAGPWAAALADRYPRERVLAAIHVVWAVQLVILGIVGSLHLPLLLMYAVVALGAGVSASFRPAASALVPQLVHRPEELTVANAVFGMIESAGTLVGPAAAAAVLAAVGPEVVFLPLALLHVLSAPLTLGIHSGFRRAREGAAQPHWAARLVAGYAALTADARARLIFALFMAQTIMRGLVNVFLLTVALTLLGIGETGVGGLFSAMGLGGLVGALVSSGLGAGRRVTLAFSAGLGAWGVAVLAMGAWPNPLATWLILIVLGLGNAVEDVAGFTLLQRVIPDHRLGRAFGAFWATTDAGVGFGSLVAPVLISNLGLRWAMIISGALMCIVVLLGWIRLRGLDVSEVPSAGIEALSRQRLFAPLPLLVIERLARALQSQEVRPGEHVMRQGALGDKFYLIQHGAFGVSVDDREVRRLGPGDAFGETALLRQVRRTATVAALTEGRLYSLEGRVFVPAVTGHLGSWDAASTIIDEHLARAAPRDDPAPGS